MNEYKKTDDVTLSVITPAPVVEPVVVNYSLDALREKEQSILSEINTFIDARKASLAEVREFIAQAEKLGVVSVAEQEKKDAQVEREQAQINLDAPIK